MATQRKERIVKKFIQWLTTLSLIIRVYLHSFSSCCFQNLPNPMKFSKKFGLVTVRGRPMSLMLVPIESAYATFY